MFGGSYPGILVLLAFIIFANFLLMRKIKELFQLDFHSSIFFSGSLALLSRLKYPNLIDGAVSASAPLCHVGLFRLILLFLVSFLKAS